MKKLLIMFVMLLSVISINADDNKKFVCENNVYSIPSTGGKSEATKTTFTWKDKKGNDFKDIYFLDNQPYLITRSEIANYKENEESEKAETEYLRLVHIKPKEYDNYCILANILVKNNKSDEEDT